MLRNLWKAKKIVYDSMTDEEKTHQWETYRIPHPSIDDSASCVNNRYYPPGYVRGPDYYPIAYCTCTSCYIIGWFENN